MSHMIEATIEETDSVRRGVSDSLERIVRFAAECNSCAEESRFSDDSEAASMLAEINRECSEAAESLRSIIASIDRFGNDRDTLFGLADRARGYNAVLLRADSFVHAVADSYHEHYLSLESGFESRLSVMTDSRVRVMARMLRSSPNHASLSDDEVIALAESKVHPEKPAAPEHTGDLRKRLTERMSGEKIDAETVDEVLGGGGPRSPLEMYNSAEAAIAGERRRRSAINAIVKAVSRMGFVIRKGNIRHIKETDTVKFVASKPGGEKAEFTIDLSGKFNYKFHGYEGLACEKDISSLEHDLEEVYGIKIDDRKVVWSNPDKTMKQHHAAMQVRRDS